MPGLDGCNVARRVAPTLGVALARHVAFQHLPLAGLRDDYFVRLGGLSVSCALH